MWITPTVKENILDLNSRADDFLRNRQLKRAHDWPLCSVFLFTVRSLRVHNLAT
jgi:hypothetical protein